VANSEGKTLRSETKRSSRGQHRPSESASCAALLPLQDHQSSLEMLPFLFAFAVIHSGVRPFASGVRKRIGARAWRLLFARSAFHRPCWLEFFFGGGFF